MNRLCALLCLLSLFEIIFAKPSNFDHRNKRSPVFVGYADDDFGFAGDDEQPPFYDGTIGSPRMPNGGFCCGGWASRGMPDQTQWSMGNAGFPQFPTYGSPLDFPQPPFEQSYPAGNHPSVYANENFGFPTNRHPKSSGHRLFGFNSQFGPRKFYGPSGFQRSFIQPSANSMLFDFNNNRPTHFNDIARRPPKPSSNEQQNEKDFLGQETAPLKFDETTGLLIDLANPFGQGFMDSMEGGFEHKKHFKSSEFGQELTKSQKEDFLNGGKFEHEYE